MNVGHKAVKFMPTVFWAFSTVVLCFLFDQAFDDLLTEREQKVVAVTLFLMLVFHAFKFTGKSIDDALESIESLEAREDGLATEYPGYGYLRSAHREVHS